MMLGLIGCSVGFESGEDSMFVIFSRNYQDETKCRVCS